MKELGIGPYDKNSLLGVTALFKQSLEMFVASSVKFSLCHVVISIFFILLSTSRHVEFVI